jgi:hypothetical protein
MDTPKISDPLLQALLRRKRVLVVIDGVSEMPNAVADAIRADKGAVDSRALVVTSRLPTNLPESLLIRPQGLTLAFLDRVLDDLIAANVGSSRFNDRERETLRVRIRSLIEYTREGVSERQVPMIFIKLMIERANQLLNESKQLDELPMTLAELVTEYTEQLLRNEQNLTLTVQQARIAAHVCMGKERSPAARSENTYTAERVSKEILDKFVIAGLMVRSGDKSDPFYKFALDPIAEQLDANRLVIDIREDRADQTELDELVRRWDELPQDFVSALRRAGAKYGREICKSQNSLCAKLWPNEVIAQTPRIARRRARKNALRLKVRQCVIQDRHFTVEQVATATGIDLESIRTELARLLEERIVERILPASPRERSSIGAPAALYRLAKSEERIEALRQSIRKMQEAQSQMENLSGAAKALLSEIL